MGLHLYRDVSRSGILACAPAKIMKRSCISGIVATGLILLLSLCLGGCSGIIKDFPETNLFAIAPPQSTGETGTHHTGKGLLVRQFDISPEFESSFFIYKISENRFSGDYYNKFMVSPARMITDAVKEALYTSAFFRPAAASAPSAVDYRLWGKIISLYADVRDPENPRAVMALRLNLEKQTGPGFIPKINRVYAVSQPAGRAGPAALVQGWNHCLEQILADFFRDLAALEQTAVPGQQSAPVRNAG